MRAARVLVVLGLTLLVTGTAGACSLRVGPLRTGDGFATLCTPVSDEGFAVSQADALANTSDRRMEILEVTPVEPRGVDVVAWRVHSEDEGPAPGITEDRRLGEAALDDTPYVPGKLEALLIVEFRSADPSVTAYLDGLRVQYADERGRRYSVDTITEFEFVPAGQVCG